MAGLSSSYSTTFGTGANTFSLDFTSIGNAGQAADTTGFGSVGYNYAIGTYSISQNEINAATANGLKGVTAGAWTGNQPAANVSWLQAAAFVNWLNISKGHQIAYNLTYSGGVYSMSLWSSGQAGYNSDNPFRNNFAVYVLPTENEWYKAAYGKNDGSGYYAYTTGSNIAPSAVTSGTASGTAVYNQSAPSSVYSAGGPSSYGTIGQGGNIRQWTELPYWWNYGAANITANGHRMVRGSDYSQVDPAWMARTTRYSTAYSPNSTAPYIGFRVAEITANAVPEPSTYALFGLGALALVIAYHRKVV